MDGSGSVEPARASALRWLVPILVVVGLIGWALWPRSVEHVSTIGCDLVVTPGASIQQALRRGPAGATICVTSGSYQLDATLVPKADQTIRGIGARPPTIMCGGAFCMDGSAGPDHVSLVRLTMADASQVVIRPGDDWMIQDVEATAAGVAGISVRGSGVSITDSYVHHNGKVGINAVDVTDLSIVGTEVSFNPTDASFGPGYSGGLKLNGVNGLLVRNDLVHDNGGGAGIWLDTDSRDFDLMDNHVLDNAQDGIRIEISCHGTLEGNTVEGSAGTGIDLFNSHGVALTANAVATPAGASGAIRMLGTGRTTSSGTESCVVVGGGYDNVDNIATGNSLMIADPTTQIGILSTDGITEGNSWSGTTFQVPDCEDLQWRWWDGTTIQRVDFAGWQRFGQDLDGSCS